MLPEKYRRLWRRRLRRRPLLPFVLAAFVAVDLAIVFVGLGPEWAEVLGGAFLAAQVSLLGIWITRSMRGLALRATTAIVIVFALVAVVAYVELTPEQSVPRYFLPVVVLLAVVASMAAAAVRAVRWRLGRPMQGFRRRLTIRGLLGSTLLIAALLAVYRDADWGVLADPLVLALCAASGLPTAWVSATHAGIRPGWHRAALVVWFPLVLTLVFLPFPGLLLALAAHALFSGIALVMLEPRRPANAVAQPLQTDQAVRLKIEPNGPIDFTV